MEEPQHSPTQPYLPCDEYRLEPVAKPLPPAWMDGGVRIGIHTSIAGEVSLALEIAKNLGANALQIFSASPRMWSRGVGALKLGSPVAERFRARRAELELGPLVVHANYLINLAAYEPVLRARSIQAFRDEIVRAMALGADFLVVHPGCACGAETDVAIALIADGIKQAARDIDFGSTHVLLENTAGQGTSVGSHFSELKKILDLCASIPVGVCVDTAHLFAAGHDFRTEAGLDGALSEISSTVGLQRVFVIHVNDSKAALGSRVDRHEHIGKGKIGRDGFRRILNHPLLAGRAFILETPIDRPGDDRRNVNALWRLVGITPCGIPGARDGFVVRRQRIGQPKRARMAKVRKLKALRARG